VSCCGRKRGRKGESGEARARDGSAERRRQGARASRSPSARPTTTRERCMQGSGGSGAIGDRARSPVGGAGAGREVSSRSRASIEIGPLRRQPQKLRQRGERASPSSKTTHVAVLGRGHGRRDLVADAVRDHLDRGGGGAGEPMGVEKGGCGSIEQQGGGRSALPGTPPRPPAASDAANPTDGEMRVQYSPPGPPGAECSPAEGPTGRARRRLKWWWG